MSQPTSRDLGSNSPSPPGDGIQIVLLGGFRLSVGGHVLPTLSGDPQRLLALLALHDRTMTRAAVAESLWPDLSHDRALARLRSAHSQLDSPARRAVMVTSFDLGLAEGVAVDLSRSRALADRLLDGDAPPPDADLTPAAVSALSDELLPGYHDDWVLIEAENWRQVRRRALEALADHLTSAGRLGLAGRAALAAARAEPLRESARAALIRVHLVDGNRSAALDELRSFQALLGAELGLEPTPRLGDLIGGF